MFSYGPDIDGLRELVDAVEVDTVQPAINIKAALDRLADLEDQMQLLMLDLQKAKVKALPLEVAQRLQEIEDNFNAAYDPLRDEKEQLTAAVKAAVIAQGKSEKASRMQAVFMPGRVTWDSKGLEGYAKARPEIIAFRKEGEPSVQIRGVK